MKNSRQIDHIGIVREIENGIITVSILNVSACAGCHAKGACSMADMKEKSIEIMDHSGDYTVGEKVKVVTRESVGWIALFLGYILPFIIVVTTLFIVSAFTQDERWIGGIGLLVLVPYYVSLALFRNKLKKSFSFTIQKIV